MDETPLKIVQISDTHLYADPEKALLGVKTEESFAAVVKHIQQEIPKFDLLIHSGDLSQDASLASYQRAAEILKPLQVPIYYVPGNHDDDKVMLQVYPQHTIQNHRHILLKNWQFILLDSHVPGAVHGHLNEEQLSYLQQCLEKYPEQHAIIVFHHQPVEIDAGWLNKLGLHNAKTFWEIVARYPQVKAVLFGHIHQACTQMINDVPCFGTPSTCIQFKCNQNEFGIEKIPPGYRWLELYTDGTIKTEVCRLPEYIGWFDGDAKGY